jgi:diguanylate cyclase (GGDEF)-like protein
MGRGVIGKASWELQCERPDEAGWAAHRARLDEHKPFRDFEFARRMPDGVVRYLAVSGDPRFSPEGAFLGYRGVGRDITEIALARERIASLAYSDPLTGLANRTSLMPALEQAVQRARRRNAKLAVVFLDLDGFKQINDLHGHDAGDALLIELAGRLRDNLRASDLIARLGGDEFLVVLEEVQDAEPVEVVAKKLLVETVRPYALPGATASVTASIGISMFPDDAADATALMKHADIAMYAAKQAGKNTCRFYSAGPAANDPTENRGQSPISSTP